MKVLSERVLARLWRGLARGVSLAEASNGLGPVAELDRQLWAWRARGGRASLD